MNDDWRLWDQMTYLYRSTIKFSTFRAKSLEDHAHCAFCWEEISEFPYTQNAGYCTLDERHWICATCFHDFKDMFEWTLVNPADETASDDSPF